MSGSVQLWIGLVVIGIVGVCSVRGQIGSPTGANAPPPYKGGGPTGPQAPPPCLSPWLPVPTPPGPRTCLWYSNDKATWVNAHMLCNLIGGNLIEMNPIAKLRAAQQNMPVIHQGKYWIGLTDIEQEGTYMWMHSKTKVGPYTAVDRLIKKAHDVTKNCVTLDKQGTIQPLLEEACSAQNWFICEK